MSGQLNQNTILSDIDLFLDNSQSNDFIGVELSPLNDIYYTTISRIMNALAREEEDLISQIQVTGTVWGLLYNRLRSCRNKINNLVQDRDEIINLNTSSFSEAELDKHNSKIDKILEELGSYYGYENGYSFLINLLTLKKINNKRGGLSMGFQGDYFDLANENGRNIKNQIIIGSYNYDTPIDIEFIDERIIKLSIKNGETDIFSTKGGYGMMDRQDLRRLLAIANIINFVYSEVDVNPDDRMGNAKFEVRKNILGKNELIYKGESKTRVLTQTGLDGILNGIAKENLVLSLVFRIEIAANIILRGGKDVGMLLGCEEKSSLGGAPVNTELLLNKLAKLFNNKFPIK